MIFNRKLQTKVKNGLKSTYFMLELPSAGRSSINGCGVFVSINIGTLMATFSPRRSREFRVKFLNRGCELLIASSGKNSDLQKINW